MKKIAHFFKSILPLLVMLVLQAAVVIPAGLLYEILNAGESGFSLSGVMDLWTGSVSDTGFSQAANFIYGLLAVLIFAIWYRRAFVLPFRHKRRESRVNRPTGFSFHTIMAMLFLAIGLQYVTILVVNVTSSLHPDWLTAYNALMESAGYGSLTLPLVVYSVLLAPISEELIFRGLIFRHARYALPFWGANIWQALLFGLVHGNLLQGIYAFVMGLFLGFLCHRGRGIKYSIPVHIVYNVIGIWFSELIEITTALNYVIAVGLGLALTVFSVWLFYTDFTPANTQKG
ncbi:MAG: CPBP family intramembrane metalloprotease [Lachnospiraceae bacterium]|nr:CPBP family intramembrane metalloprotease [Lachnospiraceae bacterium]